MPLTSDQEAEVKRLVTKKGLTVDQATALVTEIQVDVPLGADGRPTVPPVAPVPISLPPPLLP